ncbi:MAG: Gfo/Idh/MocA family oxidoreductase [Flavobacteriales bacterium]|nr:Gfo/Idh/MocA family oxidoreductase [Flavobacteriales bacterium]
MIKIGVIGAGHLGKIHIRLLKEIKEFEVVGFFDSNQVNAQKIAEEFNVKTFQFAKDLIEKCDAVDVVTPTKFHFEYAKMALEKNKHLFVEKPITATIDEAEELVRLTKGKDLKVQVGHVERFNPAFTAIQKDCKNPMFIEAHRLAEFNPRGTDVPVVHDLMIHDIDIILKIVDSKIKSIHASGVSIISDTPDIANARIEFENGCVANLTASRISLKSMRKTRVFQKDAYIAIDFLEKKAELIRMKDAENLDDPYALIIDPGEGKTKKQIQFESPKSIENNAIKDELSAFYNAIKNNANTIVSIEDAYKALNVAQQISEQLGKQ